MLKSGTTNELVRCPHCFDASERCGLSAHELAATPDSIKGKSDMQKALRYLTANLIQRPRGWLTLWGSFGTAKSLAAQAIVAGLVRRNVVARYYHARKMEQLWLDDVHTDTANFQSFESVPVLVVDEVDKLNLRSEWIRHAFQQLADSRYRSALTGETLTIWIVQNDPVKVLPGDIASRMSDGRFYRSWDSKEENSVVVERFGGKFLPSVLHVTGADARPYMRPHEAS